jgi:beta-lactamase class A
MKNLFLLSTYFISFSAIAWQSSLEKRINAIDKNFEGEVGVVIKNLKDGSLLEYNADQQWYLSSTLKVIVAISLLEEVEKEKINLEQKIILKKKDYIDGAGPLLWSKPGKVFSVSYLLQIMLQDSDNTATDMLIRLIGVDELNRDFNRLMPEAGEATTLLDVRYFAFKELHPKAKSLTNMDFIQLKNYPLNKRHTAFAEKIKIPGSDLKAKDLEEAYERYYSSGKNSAKLQNYVHLLEKLDRNELLNESHTALLLNHMENMKTGENRIKAGLTSELKFFQKTGTQINRACNVGLIRKRSEDRSTIALAVCIKKPNESVKSDSVFKQLGHELLNSDLL